ncbi:hypothetical protein HX773_15935, partial [Pantoea sp. B9002]|uniref:Ig-like domain-containing protein n=1 Tax=Pantoea sp. B9002 TaxID=2726979 RepID=UPI0015A1C1F9
TTSDATPRLEGRAGNNAVVEIWINEGRVDTIMADQFGYWRYTPTLSEGANSITVVSQGVSSDVFNIDFAPVVIPVEPELTVYPLGSDGDVTYQRMANVFGKAPAGSMITLLINEQAVATIIVNDNGDWSFYTALFNGENRVSIAHGNDVSETTTVTLVGSPAPAISFAHDDEGVRTYVYHNAATDDATPQLQGTAAPNAIVQIYRGTQNIGSAAADINGNWIFDASINPGLNEISVVENGITSEVFNITLEVAPTITGLFADGDLIENGGASNGTSFVLQGTAQPYAQVAIDQTGSRTPLWTTADQFGNWSVPVVVNVNGTNSFYVTSGGQYSEGYSFTYIPVAELPEDAEMLNYIPLIGIVHDSVGSLQWVQNNGWTDVAQPEIYGTYARPNSIVTIVDGNNNVIGSTTADNSGDWRFIPSEPLAPGKYDFYAQNEFGLSGNPFTLNLRDPEPAPLMFAWDDTGDLQGLRWSGELMDDTTPTFHGSTQPFSQISLFNGEGELLGTATSGWNGAWTIDIVEPLQSGRHSFVAVDEKGKSSDVFVLNIVPVNDAQLPEMSSLLADASMMIFAAQPSDDEQQEIVELNISEEDMAITTLDTGVIVESIGQDMLSAQQLEEEYNLNTL